jgi:hypothetical protein
MNGSTHRYHLASLNGAVLLLKARELSLWLMEILCSNKCCQHKNLFDLLAIDVPGFPDKPYT